MSTPKIQTIVSMEYDDLNPDKYKPGTFIGMVVKVNGDRMKVVYYDDDGRIDFCWLRSHKGSRWIDVTYQAIVHVEEAAADQREFFYRMVPPGKRN